MSSTSAPTISLSLTVADASAALDFYTRAFGAQELFRMPDPRGGVAHAEFMLGNTHLYISDEAPEWFAQALPQGTLAPCLYVIDIEDCDQSYQQAVEAGARSLTEPQDLFWGRRSAVVADPWGYRWSLSQHIEDVAPEELARRAQAFFEQYS